MMNESAAADRSYYEILGVGEHATDSEIRKAYKGLARKLHPDKQKTEHDKKEANDKFATMQNAYEVLIDPAQRKLYNRKLAALRAKSKGQTAGTESYYTRQKQQHNERSSYASGDRRNGDYYRRRNSQETKHQNQASSRRYQRQSTTEQSFPPRSSSGSYRFKYSSYNNTWSSSTAGPSARTDNARASSTAGTSNSSNRYAYSSSYNDNSSSTAGATSSGKRPQSSFSYKNSSSSTARPSSSSNCHGYNNTWSSSSSKAGTSSHKYNTSNDAKKTKYGAYEYSTSSNNHKSHCSSQNNPNGPKHVFGYRADGEPCRPCMNHGCFCYQPKDRDPTDKANRTSQHCPRAETQKKNPSLVLLILVLKAIAALFHTARAGLTVGLTYAVDLCFILKNPSLVLLILVLKAIAALFHTARAGLTVGLTYAVDLCFILHQRYHQGRVYGIRADGQPCLRCIKQRCFCYQHVHQQQRH